MHNYIEWAYPVIYLIPGYLLFHRIPRGGYLCGTASGSHPDSNAALTHRNMFFFTDVITFISCLKTVYFDSFFWGNSNDILERFDKGQLVVELYMEWCVYMLIDNVQVITSIF